MTDSRPCTCAPDERPYPCQHQYALGLCRKAEIRSLRIELDRLIAQIADLTKLRLEDGLVHGNIMGRIAVALFGDQNNCTDEECVSRAAEIGYELSGAKQRAERAEADLAAARALLREARDFTPGAWITGGATSLRQRIDTALFKDFAETKRARDLAYMNGYEVAKEEYRELLHKAEADLAAARADAERWRRVVAKIADDDGCSFSTARLIDAALAGEKK